MAARGARDGADWVPLRGSGRKPLPGARRVADADANDRVTVTVLVRRREALRAVMPRPLGMPTTHDERVALRHRFAAKHGATQQDLDAVAAYLRSARLTDVQTSQARRTVTAHGSVRQMNTAFGVDLGSYKANGVCHRGRVGRIHIPRHLDGMVEAVLGLDNRVQALPHHSHGGIIPEPELPDPRGDPRALLRSRECASLAAFAARRDRIPVQPVGDALPNGIRLWPAQIAALYDFPTGVDGMGETIGIIALGEGLRDADVRSFFRRARITPPRITTVSVGGGPQQQARPARGTRIDDTEVMLDVALAGSIAPKAAIVLYIGGQDDQAFFNAVTTAVHDTRYAPSVISISWGQPEQTWTRQARDAVDAALADASALGVTVLCAAGDHGAAGDGMQDGVPHVDFPAASPNVVACGGTMLIGMTRGTVKECAWNDRNGRATGGGISRYNAPPPWQRRLRKRLRRTGSKQEGRGVPDIAGNASPLSGYIVHIRGRWRRVAGTSAVAPLYAGLCALINEARRSPVGALAPQLYEITGARASRAFRDVRAGDNSIPPVQNLPAVNGYRAHAGWDACTGLGGVNGQALLEILAAPRDSASRKHRNHR